MRDHIDFIQTQHLPWQPGDGFALPHGTELKVLSTDEGTGELSGLVRFAANCRLDRDAVRDLEFLVLEGEVRVGSVLFERYNYGFIPAGDPSTLAIGAAGAVLLYFTSPIQDASIAQNADAVARRQVGRRDLNSGVWDGDFDKFNLGSMKEGARMRILREDPFSGETSYLTATMAFRRGSQAERHPIVQELFLLSGELAGERGIMQAGAYCIRPPMAKHGPYGSPTGALIFFRGLGGPQETHWEAAPPFRFDPPHDPILPERLAPYSQPIPRAKVY